MACSKNTVWKIITGCLTAVLLIPAPALGAEELDWINFTSFKTVRQMRLIDDTVYVVSAGGILAVTDPDQAGIKYTNLDGLGTNDVTDIMQDRSGQKWITGFGRLIKFSETDSKQYLFFDIDDNLFRLHRVVDDGDYLWVGTDLGLVLFSKTIDGGQIQDSYQLFDDLNPDADVYDILLTGDSIWLATSSGLAVADRRDPLLLKSPSAWTGFGMSDYPTLGTDTIIAVTLHNSSIYAGTRRGMHRLALDAASPYFVTIPLEGIAGLNHLKVERDSLFAYYHTADSGRIAVVVEPDTSTVITSGLSETVLTGIGDGAVRWVATDDGVFYSAANEYIEYPFTGIPGNYVSDIAVTSEGEVTAGFGTVSMARYVDDAWTEFDLSVRDGSTVLMSDSADNIWMGTVGNGVFMWDGDTVRQYDQTNSSLRGIGASYVVIVGLTTDGNYLYATSFRAVNDYFVAIADLNNLDDLSGWDSIGVENGLTDGYLADLALYGGSLAVATERNGVFICDVGDDPFNRNITCQQFTRENSLLISNNTRAARYSPDGALYVGTTNGLSRYDSGIDRFVDVNLPAEVSSNVRALAFDGRGNLWVGTAEGLAYIDASTGETEIYNTLNSGVVSDDINSVTFDPYTGDVYIGTTSGFSVVSSRMGQPTFVLEQVLAFPNPFIIDDSDDRLSFNFGESGQVRIFNVAGELVRETTVITPWDGKNETGEDVASGVYIFVITDREGNVAKGKFLLIRQ